MFHELFMNKKVTLQQFYCNHTTQTSLPNSSFTVPCKRKNVLLTFKKGPQLLN